MNRPPRNKKFNQSGISLELGDSKKLLQHWPSPVAIIVDGPYGLGSYPGDPPTSDKLAEWYLPHIKEWSKKSTPLTTLWFWNSEIGWATVHPILKSHGWTYRNCHIWDKGLGHIAGNANSKTLRKFPVVSEVCIQYVREAVFYSDSKKSSMQDWLRHEWARTGLPFNKANEACGVKNAATRKYLTPCHLWYYPPVEAFTKLVNYANKHGKKQGKPYFSLDGKKPLTNAEWAKMRAKFYCNIGTTNIWKEPPIRGIERIKNGSKCVHMNQKPLRLLELIINSCTDPGDIIWEPFGGLCSVAAASYRLNRFCYSAEILPDYFEQALQRIKYLLSQGILISEPTKAKSA